MRFEVVTLFPEMVTTVAEFGVVGRAQRKGLMELGCENPRDHTHDVHRTVDDRPYGGGPGMVMMVEPLRRAIAAARAASPGAPVAYLSPQGECLDQPAAKRLARRGTLVEVLDAAGNPVADGELGEAVITGLCSHAQPFIRYRTGDMVRLSGEPCRDGRECATVEVPLDYDDPEQGSIELALLRVPASAQVSRPGWPSGAAASGVSAVGPMVPKSTLTSDRFMALHMMFVRMMPEAPTNEPEMISTLLSITKPVAAAARPE